MPLLEVRDLSVSFPTADGIVQAVRGLSFHVDQGRTLGIVGESGSGKSVATQSIVGLTEGARISGQVHFEGRDLLGLSAEQLRHVRGAEIALIFQDPLSSLHPLYRVGWQIVEAIRAHERVGKSEARLRAIELLRRVGIPRPESRVDDYPHQFSGGMRQRAMIAMALALNPKLLIADEPTTALDVTVQAQIVELMKELQAEFGTAIVAITHDLGVIAEIADEVLVMYAGRAMERGDRRTLYRRPHHPYTKGLIEALPGQSGSKDRLVPIPGRPPSLIRLPTGCPFHPRCRYVMERCRTEVPPLQKVTGGSGHVSACWLPPDRVGLETPAASSTS
ncbi:MAG TPA: ABC transporter ATP-binding protein [Gaiellaceae bacterium]